ncbi:Pre-mRNA-splicing factor cef1 [Savitreella phatthalungensis]
MSAWTNVEDEILKAAIAKYGLNQWARISSLLVRKTPKQCKARWREWLDPGIRKLEWTRDEDEKLLHAVKLFPSQWRTVAGFVGRTSTQCLARYQRLLDDADGAAPLVGEDALMQQADTDPETKVAKPDAIDMDEEEKEMLSEARARLANTMGKKAKRKQREKLLEETKRVSVIQKRRELKAAGVNMRLRYERGYNDDVHLERTVPLGFYDVTDEVARNNASRGAYKPPPPKKEKQREADKRVRHSAADITQLKRAREVEKTVKRRKLELEAPQDGVELDEERPRAAPVKGLFSSLPKPKNDFEIDVDGASDDEGVSRADGGDVGELDAEELDRRRLQDEDERRRRDFLARPRAEQIGLPRPTGKVGFVGVSSQTTGQRSISSEQVESPALPRSALPVIGRLLQRDATRCLSLEKVLTKALGGYLDRAQLLSDKLSAAHRTLSSDLGKLHAFQRLATLEQAAAESRLAELQERVSIVRHIHTTHQLRHESLLDLKDSLLADL